MMGADQVSGTMPDVGVPVAKDCTAPGTVTDEAVVAVAVADAVPVPVALVADTRKS